MYLTYGANESCCCAHSRMHHHYSQTALPCLGCNICSYGTLGPWLETVSTLMVAKFLSFSSFKTFTSLIPTHLLPHYHESFGIKNNSSCRLLSYIQEQWQTNNLPSCLSRAKSGSPYTSFFSTTTAIRHSRFEMKTPNYTSVTKLELAQATEFLDGI